MAANFWEKDAIVKSEDKWWEKDAVVGSKEEAPKDKGFFSNIGELAVEGGQRAIGSAKVSPSVISGNVGPEQAGVISEQLGMKPTVQPKELTEVQGAFKDEAEAWKKAQGFTESVSPFIGFVTEFGKQALTNPKGVAYMTAQSAANMAPSIAGMIAGGKMGSVLGPYGALGGAMVGGFAGEAPLEIGAEFIDNVGKELKARDLDPTKENVEAILKDRAFVSKAVSESRTKGATTAAVDSLMTAGAGRVATAPRRAAIKTAQTELGATADAAKIAARADEILKQGTRAERVGRTAKQGAKAVGLDVAGGGLSEAAGQYAAYGEVDPESVLLEMLGELGGSAIEVPSAAYATGRDALKAKAKKDAAKILEEERAATKQAEEPVTATQPQAPAETTVTDIEDLEKQFGMAPAPAATMEDVIKETGEPVAEPAAEPAPVVPEVPKAVVQEPAPEVVAEPETPAAQPPKAADLAREQDFSSEYDTPEQNLRESDAFGQDLLSMVKGELDSYGRAAVKNRKLTEKFGEMSDAWAAAADAAKIAFARNDYEAFKPYEQYFRKTAKALQTQIAKNIQLIKDDEKALAEMQKPLTAAEEMEGVPAPREASVEAEVEKLTKDQEAAIAEREKLEKRTAGTSLIKVLKGTLNDGELSELGGRARKVGKNPFLNLKASKGQVGSSIDDMVESGRLDLFLPEKMRPDHPDYVNSESAEYIREKLRNNQFYTYETELAIQRADQDIEYIERRIQELLSDDEINKELQYAADEQRELDQAAQEPAAPEADRDTEQRETKATDDDLDKREAQLDREAALNEREAKLLEERKRLEEERLKLESPTKEQVVEEEERKTKAAELDEKEQIRKESEAGAGQFELTREEGRQDTTGDIFNQPEPKKKPEPKTAAKPAVAEVSPEQEKKEALDQLKATLSIPVPPFTAVSAHKQQLLKPAPLTAAQKKEILGLAEEAIDRGLPAAVLGNVTAAGSTRMDVTAVMSQSGWLMIAKKWKDTSRIVKLQVLIHELAHAVDTFGGTPSNGKEWQKAHDELHNWYSSSNNKARHPMSYPFAPQYKGKVRPKMESFAQAFSFYFVAPADLQANAPEAYSQIQSIVQRIKDESQTARARGATKAGTAGIKIQPARVGKGAELQPGAGKERVGISGAARLEDRGAGEVSGASAFNQDEIEKLRVPNYKGRERIVEMRIEDFLSLADDYTNEDALNREKKATAERLLREGKPYNTLPYLTAERDGKVSGHEGRHRAQALKDAGYTTIPVVIKSANIRWDQQDSPDRFDYVENWPEKMKAQDGARNPHFSIPFPVKREEAALPYGEQDINASVGQNIFGEPVLGSWTQIPDTKLIGDLGKDDVIYKLQDKLIDTKRVVQAITNQAGKIATQWNPYLQEELYHGRTAKETSDFLSKELRPLMQEMHKDGITIGEFEQYLHNRHAEAYNRQVAKVNPNDPGMQDGGSGIATKDAQEYLANLPADKKAQYEALAKKLDAITKGTRELLVKSGLETKEAIEAWEKVFPDYVPLQREEEDFEYITSSTGTGRGFDVRGPFSRRAMGSKRKVVDILANVALQRENAIVKANKNRVAVATYGLAIQQPNPDFWLAINPEAEKVPEAALDELRALGIDDDAISFLMKEPRQRSVDPKKNEVMSRINAVLRNNDSVLSARVNGQNRYVFFNPNNDQAARAASALKNLDADQLGNILGTISKITRWMASVNTQYNPIFGAYNFLRDTQGAALQLSDTPLAGKQKEVLKNSLPALSAIYSAIRGERKGKQVDTEMAKLWEDFQKAGGQTGFRDMYSRSQERSEALQKELRQMSSGKVVQIGRAMRDWLSDYNDTMENAVRLAAYKTALDNGISRDEAASIAKNLTVNFNRKGQIATQAGALYAFFNAGVQGTTRLVQTMTGPAGRKIMAGGLLWGAMQASLLAMAGFDDEEPPEFVRERNFIIPTGWLTGKKDYVTFPMPLGYHVIPGTSRILTEWAMSGFKDTPERLTSLTGMYLDAFNPIGNAGWSVQTIAPTFADPLVALAENRDWTGKPIAKKDFSGLDPTPGYTRAKDAATWYGTQIAKFLNFASGGTKYQPGVISPTPDQIDYLIGQATGGVGRELGKLATTVEKKYTGEDLPAYKIPVIGRFYGEATGSAAEASRFYKNLERINKLDNEIKGRKENHEPLGDFLSENPEARLAKRGREIQGDIKKLKERKAKLLERNAPRESIKVVEEQITRKHKLFNDQVASFKK